MKNLRVCIVIPDFPVISQTFIYNQIVDLIQQGYQLRIFALNQNYEVIKHQTIKDYNLDKIISFKEFRPLTNLKTSLLMIKTIWFNRRNFCLKKFLEKFKFFNYQTKNFDLEFFNANFSILKDQNFDIIHAHFGEAGIFVADLKRAGFFSKTKFVTTFHGYDLNPTKLPELKNRYAKLFREVDLMTVNSPYALSLLEQISGRKEMEILPVGLDTKKFKRENSEINTQFKILFVGRLIELKGPKLAIEIVERLLSKGINNIELIIAGDGELRVEIEKYITKRGLGSNIKCIGAISQEKVVELMNNADIFILPGIYDNERRAETQGLVIQEAQAMQLPVLISDVGGMKYGLLNGKSGFIIKEKDVNDFADKIEILLKDKNLRKKMGKEGRMFVKKNYDSRVLGDRLEKIYYQLLS